MFDRGLSEGQHSRPITVDMGNNGRSKLEYARPTERWSIDFVHETLADGRPCRVLTVVDNWSWQSPVLEVGGDGRDGQLDVRSRPERRPAFSAHHR